MGYLAIELAIFERLTGAPLDSSGQPIKDNKGIPTNRSIIAPPLHPEERLPSYGMRIPIIQSGRTNSGETARSSDIRKRSFRTVKVFPENTQGEEFQNAWPAVSFYWYDEQFNPSTYVYADPFVTPAPGAPTFEVKNAHGKVISEGPTRGRSRAHPDPYDLVYMIRAWSKDPTELRLICARIKELFPARGAIEVKLMDESTVVYDMMLESIINLDEGQENSDVSIEAEERSYSRGFLYRVESYVDNTTDEQAAWEESTVRERILELTDIQRTIVENVGSVDLLQADAVKYSS